MELNDKGKNSCVKFDFGSRGKGCALKSRCGSVDNFS